MGLKRLMLAAGMILSAAFAFADNGTEFGIDDDLTVWGTQGSTADADVEIKGFTVFGSTTENNLAVFSGTGSVFMGGALEVSSNTYLRGNVLVGTTTSQGIFAVKDNFVVTSGGSVGIGTSNPGTLLDVYGVIRSSGLINPPSSGSGAYLYSNAGTGYTGQYDWSSDAWKMFQVDGNPLILNGQSVANVGIGTTSPGAKLEVSGDAKANNYISTQSKFAFVQFDGTKGQFASDGTDTYLDYIGKFNIRQAPGQTAKVTIQQDGSVGIGTTGPGAKLEVSGNILVGTGSSGNISAAGTNTDLTVRAVGSSGYLRLGANGADKLIVSSDGGVLVGSGYISSAGPTDGLAIQGNVGIGTTGPAWPLHVNGNIGAIGTGTDRILYLGDTAVSDEWGAVKWNDADSSLRLVAGANASLYNQVTIQSGGNVGIGTTNPGEKLEVSGNIKIGDDYTTSQIKIGSFGHYIGRLPSDGSLRIGGGQANILLLNNVGIGTTSPGAKLEVNGSASGVNVKVKGSYETINTVTGAAGDWVFGAGGATGNANDFSFYDGVAGGAGIAIVIRQSSGNVGIGTMSPTQKLSVYGNADKKDGGTAWATWSDKRLKKNIGTITQALAVITKLRGVTFEWKDQENRQKGTHMGMVAQEVEQVIPQWILEDNNGYKLLQPEGFEGLIVEAMKEQQKQVEALETENDKRKLENEALKSRIEALEAKLNAGQ